MFNYDDIFYTRFSGSSSAFLGINIHGKYSETWWLRGIVKPVWRIGKKINDLLWQFKYRYVKRHKYHLIDTGLEPGYCDIDHIMLHGMFALLTRYVDEEHEGVDALKSWGEELCDSTNGMAAHSDHAQGEKELEAVALYNWWHVTRPADLERCDTLLHILYGKRSLEFEKDEGTNYSTLSMKAFDTEEAKLYDEFRALEAKIETEETEMLHRLIDIRGGLWT